ncbi:MAG: LacI family DNA-binding transcriptional regulator [Acidobacteria bacterium]|nr:LacI family DNA-binding transcriptional regulator [Acidobacteriota bacterium]
MTDSVPTIYDVAKLARVSTYTVSCVVNKSAYVSPELTERVRQAVRQLDYTPNAVARSLQTRSTKTLGMLIPDIANPFYARVVRGVEDRLSKDGYSLLLGNTYNEVAAQARYLNLFRGRQVDALLLFMTAGGEDAVERMVRDKRPVVCVGRVPQNFACDSVSADNITGTKLAVEHLIKKGHKTIGLIAGELGLSAGMDRAQGWRAALRKHRIKADDSLIESGDWTEAAGCEAAHRLMDHSPAPTAIFAANFLMMTGVLRALKERKVAVPAAVEVSSSDDSEWLDVFSPPITTVVQPSYEMGERAADLALRRLADGNRPFTKVVLEPALRVRS